MPSLRYVRLYSGPDGESHFSDDEFQLDAIGGPGSGQVLGSTQHPATEYGIRVVPSGWKRDWGPADHPILAVYLSGEAEIEASDNTMRLITAGTVLLAEDTSGPGHRVRVIGEEPVTVIQIHLPG